MALMPSCRRRSRPIEVVNPQVPNASRCREIPPKSTFTGSLSRLNPAPDAARIEPLERSDGLAGLILARQLDGHFASGDAHLDACARRNAHGDGVRDKG